MVDEQDDSGCAESGIEWRVYPIMLLLAVLGLAGVLAEKPDHFGAQFQLAKALDAAQEPAAALIAWERFVALARVSRHHGPDAQLDQFIDEARARVAALEGE